MNQVPQTIEKVLEVLASKFGTTVAHLWGVMVRQQIIEGVYGAVVVIGVLFAVRPMIRWTKKMTKKDERGYGDDNFGGWIGFSVISVLLLIAFFSALDEVVGALNPEYGALKDILLIAN